MENIATTFELMVNSYSDADELMNFAATWGIQDSPRVRFRLFQLRNPQYGDDFVEEELANILQEMDGPTDQNINDLELALEYVREQEEAEDELIRALLLDEEMDKMAKAYVEDGEWSPQSPMMMGGGNDPQPGPSHRPEPHPGLGYSMRKKSERTYAKNAAVDRTYEVKVDDQYRGQKLQDLRQGLHQMFDEVLDQARGDLAGNDLGRVVIHHERLNNPIVVPLQPWDQLNAAAVMETVEKVLNSNEDLDIDESFDITVGSIDLPKGGTRRRITKLKGKSNSLQLKTSIITIENEDQLCMARAIGVGWAKLNRCTPEEWKEITKTRNKRSNLELIMEHHQVPLTYYKDLCNKNLKQQKQLAVSISQKAGVPMDRPASLQDLEAFEKVLGVRVMVVSAKLGNKFITSSSNDERPCIYLYLVDDDHFHAITSITGFFSAIYFCPKCLKHYDHRESHQCETSCIVCKTDNCPETENPLKVQRLQNDLQIRKVLHETQNTISA